MDIKTVKEGLRQCIQPEMNVKCFRCPYEPQCEEGEFTIIKSDALEVIENLEKALAEKQKHLENLQKVNEELEERIAIMEDGQSGWHFSGTPELPGDALYVYVIVWTGYGRTYPLAYCKRSVRGKYVFRYEWINGDIYRGGEIKAWKYFPEPPKEGDPE